ncbi:hypothetical protein [Schaalia sp. Marseille-Q2122]|uniref:hypothetical protein n=1 Tax=Schaalia sp. Marseille-Q2122 TaxID=2736604 RepID=UPI00158F1ECF|nr:hypothetical protein [Schaalia sp. Marseille-Q2122]
MAPENMRVPFEILDTPNKAKPSADFESFYRQETEYYLSFSDCMKELGWGEQEVLEPYTPRVAVQFNDWWLDRERFIQEGSTCLAKGGPQPMPPELSVEVAEEEYEKAKSAHECLVAHGANLPEFPAKQTFFDYFIGKRYMWDPAHNFGIGKFDHSNDPLFGTKPFKAIYEMCPW